MRNDEYVKARDEAAAQGTEYPREWYDSNGFPYPVSGVGTDNTIAPWLPWCDECKRYHPQNDHSVMERLRQEREDRVNKPYDSRADTLDHIELVKAHLALVCAALRQRGTVHDKSKFVEPEKSGFDRIRPLLDSQDVESDEYKATLAENQELIGIHHKNNRHHPEHFENGIAGMTLIDLVEMLCDWAAASQRKPGGKVRVQWAVERFGIERQLASIIANTVEEMGW